MRSENIKFGERERLLNDVAFGRISREFAEQIAKQSGFPLEVSPGLSEFDPLAEAVWSLSMAIAWIVWRDPYRVMEVWTDYRAECLRWRQIDPQHEKRYIDIDPEEPPLTAQPTVLNNGVDFLATTQPSDIRKSRSDFRWELTKLAPLFVSDLETEWEITLPALYKHGEVTRSKSDLWRRLFHGELAGTGIDLQTAASCEIPLTDWSLLKFPSKRNRNDVLEVNCQPRYQDVRLSVDDVTRLWPNADPILPQNVIVKLPVTAPRTTPVKNRADVVLTALYPDGLPGREKMGNKQLYAEAEDWFDRHPQNWRLPSFTTFLRAAGRR